MKMKRIAKQPFDRLVELTHEFRKTSKESILRYRIDKAIELVEATGDKELTWCSLLNFIDGILFGVCEDATNDEIYSAMRVLGWEVVDDEKHPTD